MKKVVLTLVFSLVGLVMFAQSNEAPKRLKYVTTAPDGSVAMTIYDDSRDDTMKLESANSFYKYQLIDTKTGEPVYTSNNEGKECTIDKSKVTAGTYNLRLFTRSFVITSKIKVSAQQQAVASAGQEAVAMNE